VEGKGGLTSHVVGDGFVELELNPAQPVGDVDIVDTLDEDGPGVGVVLGDTRRFGVGLFVKELGRRAVDEGAVYLHPLDPLPCCWRHGVVPSVRGWLLFEGESRSRESERCTTESLAGQP
jgi:hypothetical protein